LNNDFFSILEKRYSIKLNKQQESAVLHKDGPAVILAVPGAGKTTVLICRTANLILNHNINPSNILSITFSKASAKDMKERFNLVFGKSISSQVNFSTIHSFAYFLIREYASLSRNKYTLIEGENSTINKIQVIKEIYMKINNSYINDDKLEELISSIGYVKNMMLDPEDLSKNDSFQTKNFSKIFRSYEDYKRKQNLVDFDDMLTLALEILQNYPGLLEKYRERYSYIQVDEGQDTSKIQHEIIKLLALPNNNLFMVADDDQSIYGFRGANPEFLLNFKDTFPNGKTFFMEENFRSTKNIVSVSNEFIKGNKLRYKKELFTKKESKRPVTIVRVKDEADQYSYILKELKSSNTLSDTAILYRNNISSIGLAEKLHQNGVPFYMQDSKLHFFKHWVVQDIMSFFKLAQDTTNINSFERIYFKMKGYLSKASLQYISTKNNTKSVFDRLLDYPEFRSFQKENISKLKSDFRYLIKLKPSQGISFIEQDLEYGKYLRDNCKNSGYSYENIKTVLSNLKIIASEANSIMEFLIRLESLEKIIDQAKFNKNKNAVILSTLHSSKGLEFQRVYMVDLIDGEFPTSNSIDLQDMGQPKEMEEERRLFYVGMTRAKEILDIITISYKNGDKVYPSRFARSLESIVDPIKEKELITSHKYKVGATVEHERFGKGKIKDIDNNVITIDFEFEGRKQLSLSICIEKKLLDII